MFVVRIICLLCKLKALQKDHIWSCCLKCKTASRKDGKCLDLSLFQVGAPEGKVFESKKSHHLAKSSELHSADFHTYIRVAVCGAAVSYCLFDSMVALI